MCLSTWIISGTSDTIMIMAITQLEKVQMLRKLQYRVTRVWRFQICNQIKQIDNIFVDIRIKLLIFIIKTRFMFVCLFVCLSTLY